VEQAKAALAFDRNELRRYRSLQSSGAVPRSLVEEKQARQLVSQSEVLKALQGVTEQRARGLSELARLRQSSSQARSSADELRKQVAQRRARLQQVDRALELATVRAPISGSVLSTNLRHPGQVMQPGELVAVLAPGKSQYELKLQVPAERISQLRPGQKATLKVSACPTAEFGVLPARVTSVSADIIPQPGEPSGTTAAVYEAVLHPLQTSLRGRQGSCTLRPGMKLTGDIVTRRTTVLMFLLNKLRLGT
jgi:HlyD family secretion protein